MDTYIHTHTRTHTDTHTHTHAHTHTRTHAHTHAHTEHVPTAPTGPRAPRPPMRPGAPGNTVCDCGVCTRECVCVCVCVCVFCVYAHACMLGHEKNERVCVNMCIDIILLISGLDLRFCWWDYSDEFHNTAQSKSCVCSRKHAWHAVNHTHAPTSDSIQTCSSLWVSLHLPGFVHDRNINLYICIYQACIYRLRNSRLAAWRVFVSQQPNTERMHYRYFYLHIYLSYVCMIYLNKYTYNRYTCQHFLTYIRMYLNAHACVTWTGWSSWAMNFCCILASRIIVFLSFVTV